MDGGVDAGEDGIVAGQEAGGHGMQCPACGYESLIGTDTCENCGADVAGRDLPQQALTFRGPLLGGNVDDLGGPDPLLVAVDTPVDAVIDRMQDAEQDCALIVDGDRLVGIFTDRDAVLKVAGKPHETLLVRELMTPDPVVLRHDDPIAVAIHKMAIGGFRHIPIVEAGRPTGIVTARDIFRHLARSLD